MRARASRAFSPPESTPTRLSTSSPEKRKDPSSVRRRCREPGSATRSERLEHRVLRDERLQLVLRVVLDRHVVAELEGAAVRASHARQQLEERRFARAVGPDERDPVAATQQEAEVA